MFKQVADPLIN